MQHLPSRIASLGQLPVRLPAMESSSSQRPDADPDRFLLQGYLLKRSETLRRWNKRWFSLDPTTARFEYWSQRSDLYPRGQIVFDAGSTITVSPINFNTGAKQYDGCCLYIGTPRKKDYFLAAETPAAAKAWVTALRAAMQVFKAHRDAVNALGNAERRQSTEAALRAAASASNKTAQAMAKEIKAADQRTVLQTVGLQPEDAGGGDEGSDDGIMDGTTIVKETLRVKDEELAQMAQDLRARDATIREMADRLSETAEAAEAAAAAAMQMDRDRKTAVSEAAQARRLAEGALNEAEGRIKNVEERAARKMKALEAEREEAAHRAVQWKAEADRAHEKARALELALRQVQGPEAAPPANPSGSVPGAHSTEHLAASTDASDAAEGVQDAPEPVKGSVEHASSSLNSLSPQPDSVANDVNENGLIGSQVNQQPTAQPAGGSSGNGEESASAKTDEAQGSASQTEGPVANGGEGPINGHALPRESLSTGTFEDQEELEKREGKVAGPLEIVNGAKQPSEAQHGTGAVDDVPAMDAGFLAAFRQDSVSAQTEKGKPHGNP